MAQDLAEHEKRNKALFENDCLLQHADRCWRAETENAARLSSRISFLFSGLVALFGLGLFKIEWFGRAEDVVRIESPVAMWSIKLLLLGSVVMFCLAFGCIMLGKRKGPNVHASELLALPQWYMEDPPISEWTAKKVAFICTYEAFLDLQEQNKEKDKRIRRAQIPFVTGFALVSWQSWFTLGV